MEGDRERQGPFRARPSKPWVSVPQHPDQHTASQPDVMMPRAKFVTNISRVLPTDG
jgi:hypothetical protein